MLPVQVHRQYIRDLSFENPAAPESLLIQETPDMQVDVDLEARHIEDKSLPGLYEVLLRLRIVTTTEDKPIFLIELDYATLVSVDQDEVEDKLHPLLFIEIPRFAFPYANQIITNTCMQGGFPPLYLRPIDFHGLYMERYQQGAEKTEAGEKEKAKSK